MSVRLQAIWVLGAIVIFCVIFFGMLALDAMSLSDGPRGPVPYGLIFGMAMGPVIYWSALLWGLHWFKHNRRNAAVLAVAVLVLGGGYPLADKWVYRMQQSAIAQTAVIGDKPELAGKTAVLLFPVKDICQHNCFDIVKNMSARVLLLREQDMLEADFSKPVRLADLPQYELGGQYGQELVAAQEPVGQISYALVHNGRAEWFDGVFAALHPQFLGQGQLYIDAMIAPVKAGILDLRNSQPLLRLSHVIRPLATLPWMPGVKTERYWNRVDRRANHREAEPYFCTDPDRDKSHWCGNAFD